MIDVRRPTAPVRAVQSAVAAHYGISLAALLSPNRSRRIAHARQVAMWIAREELRRSFSEIGRAFGRDHSTVAHAVETVSALAQTEPVFAAEICRVRDLCAGLAA